MKILKQKIILFVFFLIFFFFGCGKNPEITFSEHIAPIIHKNCTPCHRPDGPGPFSLITYTDVTKHKKMIRFVTTTRYMPPWPADPNYVHFADEKTLSEKEIQLISQWVENGAPVGDTTKMLPLPVYPEKSLLGKPDLVLKMKEVFPVRGDSRDRFALMKYPWEIVQDTFIKAIEF